MRAELWLASGIQSQWYMIRYVREHTKRRAGVRMVSNVVKLKPETYERVRAKAREQGSTMQDIITRGIDALDRLEFAQAFKHDYEAMRTDHDAWSAAESERELWETALGDGLES